MTYYCENKYDFDGCHLTVVPSSIQLGPVNKARLKNTDLIEADFYERQGNGHTTSQPMNIQAEELSR